MPLQNRVLPSGEIVAVEARGMLMGNRGGVLHGGDRRLGARRWASAQWISCVLAFKGRRRSVMTPGRYTELFFLDEATALASGHRPCFECRREAAKHFASCWAQAAGPGARPRAGEIDRVLHTERICAAGTQRRHRHEIAGLPAGTIVLDEETGRFMLIADDSLRPWSAHGYGPPQPRPRRGSVWVLTPPSIIGAMKCGYRPIVHETARDPV